MSNRLKLMLPLLVVAALCRPAVAGPVYDAVTQFGATNPSGVWSYGYSSTTTGFTSLNTYSGPAPGYTNVAGLAGWSTSTLLSPFPFSLSQPAVLSNTTGGNLTYLTNTVHQPGWLNLLPFFNPFDNSSLYAIVRFTAPVAGNYSISSVFKGLDSVTPTSSDVHVLHNSSSLFSGTVGAAQNFAAGTIALAANDKLSFVVGPGSGGNLFDSTGLQATVTQLSVPDHGVSALLALAIGLAVSIVRWRR